MKKLFAMFFAALLVSMLTGCGGTVSTGNVGVRTSFGSIEQAEVQPGWYWAFLSSVDEYTAKETSIALTDLTPKALDKLLLKDLDVAVYYRFDPSKVADFASTHSGMSAQMSNEDYFRPGFFLLDNIARGVISDEVSKFDSMSLHQNRQALEAAILKSLAAALNKSDPGYFTITRVNVTSLLTDSSIEDSIRKNVSTENDIKSATAAVRVKQQEADAYVKTAKALTPLLVQHEYVAAIKACAENPNCNLTIIGGTSVPLVNLPGHK